MRKISLTRAVSFPSAVTKVQLRKNEPDDIRRALLGIISAVKPEVKPAEEKTSRCINYDKNTEIFNMVQSALKTQNEMRERMLKNTIENQLLSLIKPSHETLSKDIPLKM